MCQQITEGGIRSLKVYCDDGCEPRAEITPSRARLLLALAHAGGFLPKREATRATLSQQPRVLSPTDRASAARSITRLERTGFVWRIAGDVWRTQRGTDLLSWAQARVERVARGDTWARIA